VAVAVVLHAALLGAYVAAYGGDPSSLVCVDRAVIGRPPYEAVRTGFGTLGYDGQFYYALARAPWARHVFHIDSAAARQLRIFYPAVSWLVSGGDPRALLWVMPTLNLLAIGGLAWLGAALALRHGLSAWWGCLLPLAVNAGTPALRDLPDVLSTFALCGLLAAGVLRWPWWSMLPWALAAVLTREQNVAVVAGLLALALWRRDRPLALGLVAVLLAWAGWAATLWVRRPCGGSTQPGRSCRRRAPSTRPWPGCSSAGPTSTFPDRRAPPRCTSCACCI
jgi:hypothetical protein